MPEPLVEGMRWLELISVHGESIPLDRAPYWLATNVSLAGMPSVEITANKVLGSSGSRVSLRRHSTRDLPIQIGIDADGPDEFDAAVNRLARAVDPRVGDVAIRYHRADGTAREILATYVDGLNFSLTNAFSSMSSASMVFEAFDPYWRSTTEFEYDIFASEFLNGGEPTPFDAALPFDAPIPFDGFNSTGFQFFSILQNGDSEAWPRWEIVGPGSQVTAVNITTGRLWSYTPPIPADAPFVVNTDPQNRTVSLRDNNVFSGLSDSSQLWPMVPGVNWLGLRVQGWSTTRSRMLLSWRERYLTP